MFALLQLFIRARRLAIVGVLVSVVAGASSVVLIAFINRTVRAHEASMAAANHPITHPSVALIAAFIGVALFTIITRMGSQLVLIRISQDALVDLRMSLSRKVTTTPLRKLETMGFGKLLPILTEDVNAAVEAVAGVPLMLANGAIILCCIVYLATVDASIAGIVVLLLVIGQSVPWLLRRRARAHLQRARKQQNVMYAMLRGLLDGNKELKLNTLRSDAFLEQTLLSSYNEFRLHDGRRRFIDTSAATVSKMMGLFVVGAMLFIPVHWPTGVQQTFVTTLLFVMGSFDVVQNFLPIVSRAETSLEHIQTLEADLIANKLDGAAPVPADFNAIALQGVTHAYFTEKAASFTLGPIDLTFERGDLVFLVGGNGSGKSTLAKLITGLYTPEAGAIRVGNVVIDDSNRAGYRQLFSAVFADFYLFDQIQGIAPGLVEERAHDYLVKLQLDHKVTIKDGAMSTTALSSGQRKRLALLVAYLEDRPFYVFDEWAADQDPMYKDIFYRQLLPELKRRGKTVLVISHDDKYFDVADRVVKLDTGQIVRNQVTSQAQSA